MTLQDVAARVAGAASAGRPLRIRGGGSKDFYGQSLEGEVLDTRALAGVVDYEPTELVVTVGGGTPLSEVEDVLARAGQMLPFEPPHFAPGATIGGAVAAGLAGPRRAANNGYYGGVRDFVLGVKLVDGRGQVLSFGGRVMKNVAGYDVSRLVAGSLGTLGVIAEVSLKVLPRPVATQTLKISLTDQARAIVALNDWGGKPLPLTASVWCAGVLTLRFEGAQAAVDAACRQIGGERVEPSVAAAFWRGVRDHGDPFFAGTAPLWRISVPSTAVPLDLPGETFIEWGGALRWTKTPADAAAVRTAALRAGGHATLFRADDALKRAAGVFTPLSAPLERIHARLKATFDPAGIFNPGRMGGF